MVHYFDTQGNGSKLFFSLINGCKTLRLGKDSHYLIICPNAPVQLPQRERGRIDHIICLIAHIIEKGLAI